MDRIQDVSEEFGYKGIKMWSNTNNEYIDKFKVVITTLESLVSSNLII